jgi:hypothetical protein
VGRREHPAQERRARPVRALHVLCGVRARIRPGALRGRALTAWRAPRACSCAT